MLNKHESTIYYYIKLKHSKNEVLSKLNFYFDINTRCKLNIDKLLSLPKLNNKNKEILKLYLNIFFDTSIKIHLGNKLLKDINFYIDLLEHRPLVKNDGKLLYEYLL